MNKNTIIRQLYAIEAVKLGNFTLKSGLTSPIYIDLRPIISYPALLQAISDLIWEKVKHIKADLLCGVPYTALPIATCLSLKHDKPMVMARKEAKNYGTKKLVEGHFKPDQNCLIIEDIVTTGASIIETIVKLKDVGLKTPYAGALVDRQQGGTENLAKEGCKLITVFTLSELLEELKECGFSMAG